MHINTYIPINDAQTRFVEMMNEVHNNDSTVAITKNGVSEAIIMSMEQWKAIQKTIEILADRSILKQLQASIREEQEGKAFKTILDDEAIDSICGKYRFDLSSSQEFAQNKKTEIELEERRWQK
jgi:prevent-host-death family protein